MARIGWSFKDFLVVGIYALVFIWLMKLLFRFLPVPGISNFVESV